MNATAVRYAEECLFERKYLYGRMQELAMVIDCLLPQLPGSIMKMIGKPQAKTPQYISETEHWGTLRAECREAMELDAKSKLYRELQAFKSELNDRDLKLVSLLYDKEYPPNTVKSMMGLKHKDYYIIRQRVLRNLWKKIRTIETIDLALM